MGSDKKLKYRISISGTQESGFDAFVFVQGEGTIKEFRYPTYWTKEEIKNSLDNKARYWGFYNNGKLYDPSDDITFG